MKIEERLFNIYDDERPRVLLLGNGFNLAYGGVSWDSLLNEIKDDLKYPLDSKAYDMPMPLKASMLTDNRLADRMREIVKDSRKDREKTHLCWKSFTTTNNELSSRLRRLIIGRYDYVLTTNYSYEIELALLEKTDITQNQIKQLMNYHEVDHAQTMFLTNTFNLVENIPIWHIHGEARKPDSIIIGTAYYGKVLRRCVERIDGSSKTDENKKARSSGGKEQEFRRNINNKRPQQIGSWIDAFVLGNLDIIGLGLDFSESDIWWLLDYKATSIAKGQGLCGSTAFYTPIEKPHCIMSGDRDCDFYSNVANRRQCRNLLLENAYGMKVEDFGVKIGCEADYRLFYEKVLTHLGRDDDCK